MDNITQWRDVLTTAIKGVVILFLLDWLRIVNNGSWFERHLDAISISVPHAPRRAPFAHAGPSRHGAPQQQPKRNVPLTGQACRSSQATMLHGEVVGWWDRVRTFVKFTNRLE